MRFVKRFLQYLVGTRYDTVRVSSVPMDELTVEQFQSNPEMVKSAMSLFIRQDFLTMIHALEGSHPARNIYPQMLPVEARAILQARTEGYQLALDNLRKMRELIVPQEVLESTFEAPPLES